MVKKWWFSPLFPGVLYGSLDFLGLWWATRVASIMPSSISNVVPTCGNRLDSGSGCRIQETQPESICGCVWKNGCRHSPKWIQMVVLQGWTWWFSGWAWSGVSGYAIFRQTMTKPYVTITELGSRKKTLAWTGLVCYRTAPGAPVMDGLKVLLVTFNLWFLEKQWATHLSSFTPCKKI